MRLKNYVNVTTTIYCTVQPQRFTKHRHFINFKVYYHFQSDLFSLWIFCEHFITNYAIENMVIKIIKVVSYSYSNAIDEGAYGSGMTDNMSSKSYIHFMLGLWWMGWNTNQLVVFAVRAPKSNKCNKKEDDCSWDVNVSNTLEFQFEDYNAADQLNTIL